MDKNFWNWIKINRRWPFFSRKYKCYRNEYVRSDLITRRRAFIERRMQSLRYQTYNSKKKKRSFADLMSQRAVNREISCDAMMIIFSTRYWVLLMCATYKDVIVKIVIVTIRQNVRDKVHFIWKLTNDCNAQEKRKKRNIVKSIQHNQFAKSNVECVVFPFFWGDAKQKSILIQNRSP